MAIIAGGLLVESSLLESRVVFSAAIRSVLLTARCKFPLFGTFVHGKKDVVVEKAINQFHDERLMNIDQSKAYTRAFDPCMDEFLGTPGMCIGKIQESFLLASQEEMHAMLAQKGLEGLVTIKKDSVYFTQVKTDKLMAFVLRINPEFDTQFITVEKIRETMEPCTWDLYSGRVLPRSLPSAPSVLTFIEARFWAMCGVKFDGLAAIVSYNNIKIEWDSYNNIKIEWDSSSHVSENGIRHYAKAVGAGMRTSITERFQLTGSVIQAEEFAALAADDPNLDALRIKIRSIGSDVNVIEIEHPVSGVNTSAHLSGYITSGQRVQAVIQAFLLPNCLELVTDGIYCIREEGGDYDRLLMPNFIQKNCGYIPNSFYTPSLCGLKVNVDKLRNYDLLGPLESSSGRPSIITGFVGSGKTTLIAQEVIAMSIHNCVFVSNCAARAARAASIIAWERSLDILITWSSLLSGENPIRSRMVISYATDSRHASDPVFNCSSLASAPPQTTVAADAGTPANVREKKDLTAAAGKTKGDPPLGHKLGWEEMAIKHEESKGSSQLIVYPSGCYDCPQKIICMNGSQYVLETKYTTWSRDVWRPQIA
ncbi:hypothetical protein T492DRAFT_843224 [Pavlovales sp. CCMP2436]|nr:hypothetical protein T492DRAFT_843224 [Pavlovales sp. CCMP2436]